ncbi:MAG: rubredoxin [Betaproteobacteria bacterium]|nr:rubredoxin [Betaproteobacteria bacterium]
MKFPEGSFERTGGEGVANPLALFECGVCWQVYDPSEGDPIGQIPPGTAFAALPANWVCPGCEAARERVLLLDDGAD